MPAELPPGFKQLRPHQVGAINEAVALFESGVDVVFMDAPTGSGKTLIGHQIARELRARALYVCSDKSLQDQFARDFKHGAVLKGRSNYEVGLPQQHANASMCTSAAQDDPCLYCPSGRPSCPYEQAKMTALSADLAVTNTSYLLHEANGPGSFRGRDLVIADEGDTLESILMGYVEYQASKTLVDQVGMEFPKKGCHKKTIVAWLDEFAAKLAAELTTIDRKSDVQQYNSVRYAIADATTIRGEVTADMERGDDDDDKGTWLRDYPWSKDDSVGLVMKPVKVHQHGVRNLWRHGQRWLVMSATIISADEMADSLGVKGEYATVRVPMTFPVENRPVVLAPVADVTYKNMDKAVKDLGWAIKVASEEHPGERMVVHTVSYKLARDLEQELSQYVEFGGLRGRKVITYTEGRGREFALAQYKKTEGAVMLAPSMSRGIDLPDDMCRVQIVAKCPFPALGDKQIAARLHTDGGQMWYSVKTIRDIVQMTGRAVRHDEDWAVTYIFDSSFRGLWSRWQKLFPEWWRESVDTRSDVRKFIRR